MLRVDRLADVLIGPQLRTAVTVLFAATAFVLLIGCANLANLALARGISRESRDGGARCAWRDPLAFSTRQLLIENVVISVCGGIVGVGVGYALMKWIQSLIPRDTLPPAVDIRMDTSVLLFALIVAVVTGPAVRHCAAAQTTNPNLVTALQGRRTRHQGGQPSRRMRGVLVVAEIALAFVLLVAAGLADAQFLQATRHRSGIRRDECPDGRSAD